MHPPYRSAQIIKCEGLSASLLMKWVKPVVERIVLDFSII